MTTTTGNACELTILMPCLNEARTLGRCILKARNFLDENHISGEVLIADNGSTDGSQQIASNMGARIVHIDQKGYGWALRGGIEAAKGKYIIMGDSDDSYDLYHLMPFVEKLRDGYDLVMGNRFKGGIAPGAMPWHHRFIGNPILSGLGKLFFRIPVNDFHCGLRGFSKDAIERMNLQTTGMEFASEIVVKAALMKMKISEVPTTLSPDGRDRPPHLRSFRDGWRHLRFLLLYSPRWLFFYPGIFLMALGGIVSAVLIFRPLSIGNVYLDINTLLYFSAFIILGFTMLLFSIMSRVYAYQSGLIPNQPGFYGLLKYFKLENGLWVGLLVLLLGIGLAIFALVSWSGTGFGDLDPRNFMRISIPSVTAIIMGGQIMFFSFILSVLGLDKAK
jgi:glycosyltransferase involved in cell wall biosynthesis